MDRAEKIKLFGRSLPALERDLDRVEGLLKIDLQRSTEDERNDDYYPQFAQAFRQEASAMGQHYEVFYCLEKTIRKLVADTLEAQHGENWWASKIPPQIQQNARENMQRELDSGVTQRSEEEIDFTTFGELGEIVRSNWVDFDAIFSSQKAFTKIMTSLNVLRAPIAHCCPLSEDEIVRLRLTVKDWFRLME